MKYKVKLLLTSLSLVTIDQAVKLIITNFFIDCKMRYKNYIGFSPFLNTEQLSIFNKELNLGLDLCVLILINIFVILILFLAYFSLRVQASDDCVKCYDYIFVFCISGAICSLIDKIFYGGSLDYVLLMNQIIDIKDVYLFIAMCCSFVYVATEIRLKRLNERNGNNP